MWCLQRHSHQSFVARRRVRRACAGFWAQVPFEAVERVSAGGRQQAGNRRSRVPPGWLVPAARLSRSEGILVLAGGNVGALGAEGDIYELAAWGALLRPLAGATSALPPPPHGLRRGLFSFAPDGAGESWPGPHRLRDGLLSGAPGGASRGLTGERGMWELQASTGLSTRHTWACALQRPGDGLDQEVSETRFIDADLAAQGSAFLTGLYGRFGGGLLLAGGKGLIAFALTSLETLCLVGRRRFITSRKQHSTHQQNQRKSEYHRHPPYLPCAA